MSKENTPDEGKRRRRIGALKGLFLAFLVSVGSLVPMHTVKGFINRGIEASKHFVTSLRHSKQKQSPDTEHENVVPQPLEGTQEEAFEQANIHWENAWRAFAKGNYQESIQELKQSLGWFAIGWDRIWESEQSGESDDNTPISLDNASLLRSIRHLSCKIVRMNLEQSIQNGNQVTIQTWLWEQVMIGYLWREIMLPRVLGAWESRRASNQMRSAVSTHWATSGLVERTEVLSIKGKQRVPQTFATKLRLQIGYGEQDFEKERAAGQHLPESEILRIATYACSEEDH